MLNKIPSIIPPELMKCMMEMGHSDTLVIADANFPGTTCSQRVIQANNTETAKLLEAILPFFPLDNFIESPITLMKTRPSDPYPSIWDEYKRIIQLYDSCKAFKDFELLERSLFYQKAKDSFVVVQTGDLRLYANLILHKGVCDFA
ncbi:MAG: RbsD/FucU family protein [Brevinema sp.]